MNNTYLNNITVDRNAPVTLRIDSQCFNAHSQNHFPSRQVTTERGINHAGIRANLLQLFFHALGKGQGPSVYAVGLAPCLDDILNVSDCILFFWHLTN